MRHRSDSHSDDAHQEPLRIGMFSESFQPVQNGVTTSVLTLIRELRANKHHVVVFAPDNQQRADHEINVLRFPSFVSVFNKEYPLAYPFVPRLSLAPYFNRLRLDIVHTHTPFVLGLTGGKLAVSRGLPLVTTFHTLYSQFTHYVPFLPEYLANSLLEHYLPWYYNRCTEIICPSALAARTLSEMGVERPIEVIPTGIPLPPAEILCEATRLCTRDSLGIAPDAPLMLYAGRLSKEKSLDFLLKVFVTVREQMPEARLLIAGGGPAQEELEALAASLPGGDAIRFLGPTPRAQLDNLYVAADVFTFPSPSETQGLVIGEARAAGLPCVVVNSGGAPETVQDDEDGFRVAPDDREAYADRVLLLLRNRELRDMMRAAALRNAFSFTPNRMAERVLAVYERARHTTFRAAASDGPLLANEQDWENVDMAHDEAAQAANQEIPS